MLTLEDLKKLNNPDLLELNPDLQQITAGSDQLGETKPSKYHNVRTEFEGETYASGREAKRASELSLLLKAGEIFCLQRQVRFPLAKKIDYIADFVYLDKDLNPVIEDAKGMKTDVYKLKKKLFKERYGKNIEEI